jgi:hypothetical protein
MIKEKGATKTTTKKETNFFVFFKRGKQNKAKETKQNKNKVKRLEVKDSPCRNLGTRKCLC